MEIIFGQDNKRVREGMKKGIQAKRREETLHKSRRETKEGRWKVFVKKEHARRKEHR